MNREEKLMRMRREGSEWLLKGRGEEKGVEEQ